MPGPEIKVFEGDFTPEGFSIFAGETMDGPWLFMGESSGTTEFELSITGLSEARYFKIQDDGDGPQNANDAGFDLDAVSDLEHIWGVFLMMYDYTLDDENGNGHLEQGETADLIVNLGNNGNITANDVTATLSSPSSYITITQATASYGTLLQNQTGDGTFTFEVGDDIPNGDTVDFTIDVLANGGIYSTSFNLQFIAGKFPILIIDLDGNHNSGSEMQNIISDIDLSAHYETSFPEYLELYQCIFVCLGVYSDNHALTAMEGQELAAYLNHGGRLYMEGGDTWAFDSQTEVHPMFKINGVDDGSDDLGVIFGQEDSFTEGMAFPYNGDNAYIDRIEATENAFEIFRNQVPSYCNAVALDEGTYKTVGSSFEFGGLADNSNSTKEELMILILEFFGGILTDIGEVSDADDFNISTWPNPFRDNISINLTLENPSEVSLEIYNLSGQKVKTVVSGTLNEGTHLYTWNGSSEEGIQLPDGMYLYLLKHGHMLKSGKIIISR